MPEDIINSHKIIKTDIQTDFQEVYIISSKRTDDDHGTEDDRFQIEIEEFNGTILDNLQEVEHVGERVGLLSAAIFLQIEKLGHEFSPNEIGFSGRAVDDRRLISHQLP